MNDKILSLTTGGPAVRLRGLRKVYKLYRKPSYRLRDILGILPTDKRYYSEHVALHDVSLDIRRGEKVAIIGRNGAGKSTLLRLITKVIEPTAGSIQVNGETQALLSLGTGFHPELTGRQNVLAYLANFGIAGVAAENMVDQVIEFAELEEYIDQPTKTYSSGMGMRLMFAASTMFVPDLLVIDEVLGVGDAYFQGKSFERIREMCSSKGATLLLVTHDVYTASTLCERMIWIDNGAVLLDSDSPTVLKAYDASIRQQEETRLRKKALLNLQKLADSSREDLVPLVIELRSPDNIPAPAPIAFSRIALVDGDREVASSALTDDVEHAEAHGRLVTESGSWGEAILFKDRPARQMNNFGSTLHKVAVSFLLPQGLAARIDELWLEVDTGSSGEYELEAWRVDADLRTRPLGTLLSTPGEFTSSRFALAGLDGARGIPAPSGDVAARANPAVRSAQHHGSGSITVNGIRFFNRDGHDVLQLVHGEPARIVLNVKINDTQLREDCQVILTFNRNGVDDVFRLFCPAVKLGGFAGMGAEIIIELDRLPLAANEYSVTGLIAAKGYYESRPKMFFSINPNVYWARRNFANMKVISEDLVATGTAVVGEARWSVSLGNAVNSDHKAPVS